MTIRKGGKNKKGAASARPVPKKNRLNMKPVSYHQRSSPIRAG
jgi:hypothetical protein